MEVSRFKKRIFILSFFVLFVLVFSSILTADQSGSKSFSLDIYSNIVSTSIDSVDVLDTDGYSRVQISGMHNFAQPGQPLLPYKTVRFLLPYGKDIDDISVGWSKREIVYGSYLIKPAQQPIPLSYKGIVQPTAPDASVYNSASPFPGKQYEIVSIGNLRGFRIAVINLFPVEYIPATGQVAYYQNMSLNLQLKNTSLAMPYELYRGIESDIELVKKSVDNPDAADTYPKSAQEPLLQEEYLIITSNTFASYAGPNSLADLAAHKTSKWGLTTAIINETTWGAYSGTRPDGSSDNATRIRNCIIANYDSNKTQYVLLVGDADYTDDDSVNVASGERQDSPIIPVRGLYGKVSAETDQSVPSDLYYACLGGTYDFDADGVYGETTDGPGGGDVDLEAEVYVGRAAVDSTAELANFVAKTIAYENSTDASLNKAIMAGEELDSYTWGGDYIEEIRNGSSSFGYTTAGMSSTGFYGFDILYDKNGSWATSDLVTRLNANVGVLNHLGHASNALLGKSFANTDADGLTNTNYFFGFTQGCYSGAFDNRNSSNSFESEDCILEHFTNEANGAVAFIGNSRYGWYSPGDTDGPSQRFHREFWDAIASEGILNLGRALQDAKQDNSGLVIADGAHRWGYFCTNLLGDPHTPLNGEFLAPNNFSAANVFVANKSWITLNWKNSGLADFQHTMIRYRTDGVYPTSSTDGTLLTIRSANSGSTDLFNHTAIESGKTYNYVGFGYDGSVYEGNNSLNNRAEVTVIGGGSGTSTGRSNCFVATVCYGSKNNENVKTLRLFRDKVLVNTFAGKQFISAYYVVGPKIAGWIENKEGLKKIVRKMLDPVAGCAASLMGGN